MFDFKHWYQSVTIRAVLGVILVQILSFFGLQISDADVEGTITVAGNITSIVFALWAIWGRVRATKTIGPK